jgi:hypothetical protein
MSVTGARFNLAGGSSVTYDTVKIASNQHLSPLDYRNPKPSAGFLQIIGGKALLTSVASACNM